MTCININCLISTCVTEEIRYLKLWGWILWGFTKVQNKKYIFPLLSQKLNGQFYGYFLIQFVFFEQLPPWNFREITPAQKITVRGPEINSLKNVSFETEHSISNKVTLLLRTLYPSKPAHNLTVKYVFALFWRASMRASMRKCLVWRGHEFSAFITVQKYSTNILLWKSREIKRPGAAFDFACHEINFPDDC